MLTGFSRASENHFWFRQFAEHAIFTEQGLTSTPQESIRKALRKMITANQQFRSEDATVLLARQLNEIHAAILQSFAPPAWSGWNYPSVIRHMVAEQNWYLGMIMNRYTPSDLLYYACKSNAEVAAVLGKMLDPVESALEERAHKHRDRLEILSMQNTFAFSATLADAIGALDDFLHFADGRDVGYAQKIISRQMIDHEGREIRYFMDLLRRSMMSIGM